MIQLVGLLVALLFLQVSPAYADDTCEHWAAKITSMQGTVETRKHTTLEWVPAKLNESLCGSDAVRTARSSRATLQVQEETFITLDERSTVRFSSDQQNGSGVFSHLLHLFSGEAYFRSRRPRELGIETPFVNAMHEGTEFLVRVNQDNTQIVVFDGVVVASNTLGQVSISEGQSALTMKDQAPAIGPRIELRDAVQWTLYYPPVIDYTSTRQNSAYLTLKPALDRFQSNDLVGAFELLDGINEAERNADYHIVYASLLLTVGQVKQAQQLLNQIEDSSQQNANVLALQSIIALAKSDQQQALKLAEQAQQINPQAAAPKIALSYAYQSLFDIDKALKSATQAVKAAPDNGLAWARVSEMQLATGNVDASMEAAKKAQTINPKLSKTNTVLGFARLASLDLSEAEQSFRTAIQRDPSDPLARLGLGLAKIRQGHIKSGTKEMETAANLDPDNALIRSYLGKAYYEQRRGDIASTEYAIAKKLDPNDPTPWFYDAIYKQTVNRPVEALHDMQKAIELNDNRAVFRSRLLLDEDLAARTANLSRIYNDLGFGRTALKESWRALNYDSSNASAHRFLSDAYIGKPRFRVARASELLQAQLLQPINITPVQPQLTNENIGILNSTGPGSLSVNEYDPLFNTNGVHIVLNGAYGSNDTKTDNAIISGVYKKLSMSLGQFLYQTDGIRQNDDYQENVYNAFAQYAFTPDFNFQFELKSENVKSGDVPLRLNGIHDFSLRKKTKQDTARIGGNYQINSEQDILISAFYTTRKEITDLFFGSIADRKSGYQVEGQYLFHPGVFDITAGLGFIDLDTKDLIDQSIPTTTERFYSGYIYSKQHIIPGLTTVFGVSFDSFHSDLNRNKRQFNPKFGVMWNPIISLTIRGAVFRTLSRPLTVNQTIEPTQVAGFNQFFDSANGTSAWQYSIGVDYSLLKNLFMGGETTWRKANQPRSKSDLNQNESHHLAYFYWTPREWMSFRTEYKYDKVDRDFVENRINNTNPSELRTHQIPLSLNLFNDSGLFAKITGTFVKQHASFVDKAGLDKHNEEFWTVDTSLGFRLPKKIGLISFEVRNLLDSNFNYQSAFDASGSQLSLFVPERQFFAKLSLFY